MVIDLDQNCEKLAGKRSPPLPTSQCPLLCNVWFVHTLVGNATVTCTFRKQCLKWEFGVHLGKIVWDICFLTSPYCTFVYLMLLLTLHYATSLCLTLHLTSIHITCPHPSPYFTSPHPTHHHTSPRPTPHPITILHFTAPNPSLYFHLWSTKLCLLGILATSLITLSLLHY